MLRCILYARLILVIQCVHVTERCFFEDVCVCVCECVCVPACVCVCTCVCVGMCVNESVLLCLSVSTFQTSLTMSHISEEILVF